MTTEELLDDFLCHWPESYHEYDQKRFIRYAVSAVREGKGFDRQALAESHLSDRCIDYYSSAFEVVRLLLDVLSEET